MKYIQLQAEYLILMLGILLFASHVQAGNHSKIELHIPADSVQIVYLANVNANYENCHCGDHPLGGLDRVKTIVKQWRDRNPHLLLFDGGDFLNAYPYPSLNRMIINLYYLLRPDLICLGDQELQAGNLGFQKEIFNRGFNILSTNATVGRFPLERQIDIQLLSHCIRIFSYLDSSAFLWEKPAKDTKLSARAFDAVYRESLSENVFRVVIYHGERDRLGLFIKQHPAIHFLLLAHSQIKEFRHAAFPWILGVGTDSEYVTRISVLFTTPEKAPKLRITTVPVELSIQPYAQARKIINAFKAQSK